MYLNLPLTSHKKFEIRKLCFGPNCAINFLREKLMQQEQNTENNVTFVFTCFIEQKKYYNGLDLSNVMDNRKFWKTIRPLYCQ